MIKSFADKETEKVFNQIFSKKLPQSIQYVALRKLILIDNAACLDDLKVPPGNRLEALLGDRNGHIVFVLMTNIVSVLFGMEPISRMLRL